MILSAYFMSKSVFDQQGCRALTFTLAGPKLFLSVMVLVRVVCYLRIYVFM